MASTAACTASVAWRAPKARARVVATVGNRRVDAAARPRMRRIAVTSRTAFAPAPTMRTLPAAKRSPSRRVTRRSSPFFPVKRAAAYASASPTSLSPGPRSPSVNAGTIRRSALTSRADSVDVRNLVTDPLPRGPRTRPSTRWSLVVTAHGTPLATPLDPPLATLGRHEDAQRDRPHLLRRRDRAHRGAVRDRAAVLAGDLSPGGAGDRPGDRRRVGRAARRAVRRGLGPDRPEPRSDEAMGIGDRPGGRRADAPPRIGRPRRGAVSARR